MNVQELIEKLEQYPEDLEVEVHYQYSYPLRGYITRISEQDNKLYIAMEQCRTEPYGSKRAWGENDYDDY